MPTNRTHNYKSHKSHKNHKSLGKKPRPTAQTGRSATRRCAATMLAAIERGKKLDEAADRLDKLPPDERALAYAIVLAALRHYRSIQKLIDSHVQKKLAARPHLTRALIAIGITQLRFMDIATHAAIHETVAATGRREQPFRGLINAVLRKIAASPQADFKADSEADFDPIAQLPPKLAAHWQAIYGDQKTAAIAAIHQQRPPLDLCFKKPEAADKWCAQNKDLSPEKLTATHLRLHNKNGKIANKIGRVENLPDFAGGDWWVQDVAAGFAATMLDAALPKPTRILEIGAAPGGKTMQLAAAGHQLVALDIAQTRLARLHDNLARTHLQAELICADALNWQPPSAFDAILLDAPCSATGTMRRHPELALHYRHTKLAQLTALQDKLLNRAVRWLAPDGILAFVTCSLDPQEGEERVAALLHQHKTTHTGLMIVPPQNVPEAFIKNNMLRTTPADWAERGGMDGFFVALIGKTA